MAARIRKLSRYRTLSVVAAILLVIGATLGMVTSVGAEDLTAPDGTAAVEPPPPTDPPTTAPPVTTPPDTAPPQIAPPTTALPIVQSTSVQSTSVQALGDISTENHTTFPTYTECLPNGSTNPWQSDSRADPSGQCTDGNIGAGGASPSFQLEDCTSVFASATNFYNSGDATGTGNDDVTGAITNHTGGGTQLNVTPDAGVVIDGVFVKAGNGYNAYIGNESNMIGPLVGNWDSSDNVPSPNFAGISHYVVCYHFTTVSTGGLDVDKTVVGTPPANTTFTVSVNCDDGTAHDGTLVFDETGALTTAGTIDALPITGIPVGTSCTVTETDDGGADTVNITGSPAVIVANTNQSVTVTNTFIEVGGDFTVRLDVDKELVGTTDPASGTEFVVDVDCTGDATIDETLTFTYPNGLGVQSVIAQLPAGGSITCTVTETDTGGAILEGYKIDGGSLQSGAPTIVLDLDRPDADVTVVNDPGDEVPVEVGGTQVTRALAFTGSSSTIWLRIGVLLLVLGLALGLVTRQRRQARFDL